MPLEPLHNAGAPIDLRLGGLELTAFSISGVATYVLVPSIDACFDLGHCPLEATRLRHVFLTHVHQDHAAGAPRHASIRQMLGARPSRIYLPAESEARFREHLAAIERLEERPAGELAAEVRGLAVGDVVRLGRHTVEAFDVVHRIASRGYTVVEERRHLRPEWRDRPGAEIGAARAQGLEIHDVERVPIFTYVGDSTIETLRRRPELGRSQVLFLEATHLGDTSPEISAKWGHTHLDELAAFHRAEPGVLTSTHIVLKHFSTRYSRGDIVDAMRALPEDLRERVTLLL